MKIEPRSSHAALSADRGAGDGRFQGEEVLGRGGMATVYEVVEVATGRKLALKRLHATTRRRRRRRHLQLFEREFHTLCHLAHPRIVQAYDYGVDDGGPYYTMELLDGGDLAKLAPLPWAQACAVARDVCSALSLLHSRRMVYRDLSPRNVRCTSDGTAKLIDFGAMVAMGPSKQLVGTPSYCAPEALNLQSLDARTDLYALGATLYYTLTGFHAYPSRDFKQLPMLWRSAPVPLRELAPDVPPALEALIRDLMQLDPAARPANGGEVMERLAAIEGRPIDEQLLVSQSYLSTPNLVGRERPLSRVRIRTVRALRGRGSAVLIEARAGVGRSRFLDACLLEAKLQGATVLRADASDADREYGVVAALFSQLIEGHGETALAPTRGKSALLGHAVPSLLGDQSTEIALFANESQLRAALQPALQAWLLAVAKHRPLLVAVDDIHAIDEPSAAFLTLLAHQVPRHAVLIIASIDRDAADKAPPPVEVLSDMATALELDNLEPEQTEQLLGSVFGEVPHLSLVAHRLHAISEGNPRDTMQLAQHLVDRGIVRYQAGAWSLPSSIDGADLPSTMAHALAVRVQDLSSQAREIAQALSLCPDRGVSFEEADTLLGGVPGARLVGWLEELVDAQIVVLHGERYALAQRGWVPALLGGLDAPTRKRLHTRLAALFEARTDEMFRVAQHLLRAGEIERGLDVLVEYAESSQRDTDDNPDAYAKLARSMPADWYETYDAALDLCERTGRPKRDASLLRSRLSGLLGLMNVSNDHHVPRLIEQLEHESGLCDWKTLPADLDPAERLREALGRAQRRYDELPESERVYEPVQAIRMLSRAVLQELGVITNGIDYARLRTLPSLEPLMPLSPALGVVAQLVRGVGARVTARFEAARACYVEVLERLDRPDHAGLDASHHRWTQLGVMNGMGMIEAAMGLSSSLDWAEQIESDPSHRVNAELIRMLSHLWQGDLKAADRARARVDLLRVQNSPRQWFEGAHLLGQVVVIAALDDLTRMKQTVAEIAPLAARYRGWVAVHDYAQGEFHRIRGDLGGALATLTRALENMEPGRHQLWPNAAGGVVRTLFELERDDEACERAERELALADAMELGYPRIFIEMPLALAEARRGNGERAVAIVDGAIEALSALGSRGLLLAALYETRARISLQMQDRERFEHFAALCSGQLRAGASRAVAARYEKLKQAARRAEVGLASGLARSLELSSLGGTTRLTSLMESCGGPGERAERGLRLLLAQCGARGGALYVLRQAAPALAAWVGEAEPPPQLLSEVEAFLAAQAREAETRTETGAPESTCEATSWLATGGQWRRPVLLSHRVDAGLAITGVAIVELEEDARFIHPGLLVTEISRRALNAGDADPIIVAS